MADLATTALEEEFQQKLKALPEIAPSEKHSDEGCLLTKTTILGWT